MSTHLDMLYDALQDDDFETAQEILDFIEEEHPSDFEEAQLWFDDRKMGNEWKF